MSRFSQAQAQRRDYYADLGVPREATHDDIKKAHHSLVLEHHPDKKSPGGDSDASEFRKVQEAYEVLRDPAKRRAYDQGQWDNGNDEDYSDRGEHDDGLRRAFYDFIWRQAERMQAYEQAHRYWYGYGNHTTNDESDDDYFAFKQRKAQREAEAAAKQREQNIIREEEVRANAIEQEDKIHDRLASKTSKQARQAPSRKNCACQGCRDRFLREQNEKQQKKKDPAGYEERLRLRALVAERREKEAAEQARRDEQQQAEERQKAAQKAAIAQAKAAAAEAKREAERERLRQEAAEQEAKQRAKEQAAAEKAARRRERQKLAKQQAREAAEREMKEAAEQEAKEAAERQAAERLAKEVAQQKAIAADAHRREMHLQKQRAIQAATEQAMREAKEAAERKVKEDAEREAAERLAKEAAEREAAERLVKEAAEQEAAKRLAKEAAKEEAKAAATRRREVQLKKQRAKRAAEQQHMRENKGASERETPEAVDKIIEPEPQQLTKQARVQITKDYIQAAKDNYIAKLALGGKTIPAEGVAIKVKWEFAGKAWYCWFCKFKNLKTSYRCVEGGAVACYRCKKSLSLVTPEDQVSPP